MPSFFPIKTKTSCQLKWNWSTLYLYGSKTASCHRTGWGQLTPENFDNFHNTPKKQHERSLMLEGKWPEDSCDYCKEIENAGGFSDRMLHLEIPNMVPPELAENPISVKVSPTILEVFFNNTCNLSCLYCLPSLSSKIHQENVKFGKFEKHGVSLSPAPRDDNYYLLLEKFWQWFNDNSLTLRRFNVLGGEPFYQDEFYKLLDFIERKPHPDLEFSIVTNLMIPKEKLTQLILRFRSLLSKRHLRRVDLTCSIDCWGEPQEYVRFGLDLRQWQENFEFLLDQKWLTLSINQTISVLTIKTMPELLIKLAEWRKRKTIGHYLSGVSPNPKYLMPYILGASVFDKDFDYILSLMPNDTAQDLATRSYMEGIRDHVRSCDPDLDAIIDLKTFLEEKDRRRGNNWRQIFPWLIKEIDHVV